MSAGLVALLDDVAALAKMAAASVDDVGAAAGRASVKAAGVVVDDTAVTPRYVTGFTPDRELPAIKKITIGSLRNKLLIILPVALLLSAFAPWLLTPILMLGGCYLSYEGAEKIWEKLTDHVEQEPAAARGEDAEKQMVSSAIRTDLILSAEIMVIALNEVAAQGVLARALILIVVAVVITLGVYGVVAVIVKMDDVGLALAQRESSAVRRIGRGLVAGMPKVLSTLAVVGTAAMLWVGGHILVAGADTLGWHGPESLVHHAVEAVEGATGVIGGAAGWVVETLASAVVGLVVGGVLVAALHLVPRRRASRSAQAPARPADGHDPPDAADEATQAGPTG